MTTQIHRKQAVVLALSIALAVASYWIPLSPNPKASQSESQATPSSLADSITAMVNR